MQPFQEYLSVSIFLPSAFCAGILFLGSLLYAIMYWNTKDPLHLGTTVLGIAGFCFVGGETMILASGWMLNPELGMWFHRFEQIAATLMLGESKHRPRLLFRYTKTVEIFRKYYLN
ncbi:MAG: hypothetical protein IPH52_01245 [Leptospiraceae bacterium]|nr:hypothetical protein [Leptospiraceae bacterium]